MPTEKSNTGSKRSGAGKRRKVSDDLLDAAEHALEAAWVRDRGAYNFLLSAGHSEAQIKEVVAELLQPAAETKPTTNGVSGLRIRNKVEGAAVRVLAGDHSPDWVWKYAARVFKNYVALTDTREDSLRDNFRVAASQAIEKARARGETIPSSRDLCVQAIRENRKLVKRNGKNAATLARWAREDFPEIRSPRGRKPKTT